MFTIRKTVTLLALGAGIIATTAFPAGEADKAKTDAVGARHA